MDNKILTIFSMPPEQNSWKRLVEIIKQSPIPFTQNDTESNTNLLFISNQIDLNDFTTHIPNMWNESLVSLSDKIYNINNNIYYSNIKAALEEADAANSFVQEEHYVEPWNNGNKDYDEVRGLDSVKSVIENNKNLQFTARKSISKFIRLIMPKYTRRVEVEDLNRNFWVIGQTIKLISDYLFGDDNNERPLKDIFKYILNEITQLWENLIYLYGAAYYLKQEYFDTQVIYLPLPNNEFCNQRKFDNFEPISNIDNSELKNRCKFLIQKYSKSNLIIVPFIRYDNYDRDYFSEYRIEKIILYNRYKNRYDIISLDIAVNLNDNITDKIYFTREIDDNSFYYGLPYQNIPNIQESDQKSYYGLLRIIPNIQANFITDHFEFSKFEIEVHDAAARSIRGTSYDSLIGKYFVEIDYEDDNYTSSVSYVAGAIPEPSEYISPTVKNSPFIGYYGELVSGRLKTTAPIIKDAVFKVVKIGDFLPDNIDITSMETITLPQTIPDRDPYDTATYGIGAKCIRRENIPTLSSALKFAAYCDNEFKSTADVTPNNLKTWGASYIRQLIGNGLPNEIQLIATKIGVGYWTGDNGTQWSHGFVSDLFLYTPFNNGELTHLGKINLFDGYWTRDGYIQHNNTGIFSYYNSSGSQWRHLSMRCDSITIKKLKDITEYHMNNGILAWFDHNKEINGVIETYNERPHCSLDIVYNTESNQYIFEYGTQYGGNYNLNGKIMSLHTLISNNTCIIAKDNYNNYKFPYVKCYVIDNDNESEWNTVNDNDFAGLNDAGSFSFAD